MFDTQGRRIAEYNEATGALIREYVWMAWEPVAVMEGGVVHYIRADHIGRPVFATNASGAKVWSVSFTPFGGVHTSTGLPIEARFPGQWYQSESGLHQNWMRDYDPTTGRYIEADPLGLIDGASVYGYVRGNPGRYSDPKGEFIVGAIAGVLGNFALQAVINYNRYGLDSRVFKCMDIKSIAVAGVLGSVGVSPLSSVVGAVTGRGTVKKLGNDLFLTVYTQLFLTVPIVIGDECECNENQGNLGLGDFIDNILGALH